jgi:hypothetical protein
MAAYFFIFGIFFIHWVADFIYQKDEDAKGKSTSLKHLLSHTTTYSLFWFVPVYILYVSGMLPMVFFLFPLVTFIAHTITDYFTSKWTARLWKEGRTHDFFVAVGFDQLLHYIQLFGTFFILVKWVA